VLYETNLKLIDFCGLIDISELRSEKVNIKTTCQRNLMVKFDGESVMLWECFTVYDVGSLNRRINSRINQEILNVKLHETIENIPIDERNIVFQHDRNPKHMAKSWNCKSWNCNHFKFRIGQLKRLDPPIDNT